MKDREIDALGIEFALKKKPHRLISWFSRDIWLAALSLSDLRNLLQNLRHEFSTLNSRENDVQ